jgi:hypothetical protein
MVVLVELFIDKVANLGREFDDESGAYLSAANLPKL